MLVGGCGVGIGGLRTGFGGMFLLRRCVLVGSLGSISQYMGRFGEGGWDVEGVVFG